jgi:hypothetical protein
MDHSSASRFSTGVPVRAIRLRAGNRRTALATALPPFLTCCALIEHHSVPLHGGQRVGVPGRRRVGGEHHVGAAAQSAGSGRSAPCRTATRSGREPAPPVASCRVPTVDRRPASVRHLCSRAPAAARSCRGPCRRPGTRRVRAGPEGQPGQSPPLVRAEHAGQAGRRSTTPAGGPRPGQQSAIQPRPPWPSPAAAGPRRQQPHRPQRVAGGHRAPAAPQERQPRGQPSASR